MEETAAQELQAHLETTIRDAWAKQDPDVQVKSELRNGGQIDMTVVSRLFAGKDSLEREAFFWPAFDAIPKSELVYMTYCLLLTPEEAARNFAAPGPPPGVDNADNWEE